MTYITVINTLNKPDINKKVHYDAVKNYFKKDVATKSGYYQPTKNHPKQQKIFDLCQSILEDIVDDNPDLIRAIDAGCGIGDFTIEMAENFPQFDHIIGIDFLKEVITIASKKIKDDKKLSFLQSDLLNIPFFNKIFDVTICLDVFHHIHNDDFQSVIGELARITNKYLIVEIRNKKNIFYFWYAYVVHPLFYRNLPVSTTSIDEVNNLIGKFHFQLFLASRIASTRYSCRRLILVYKRVDGNKSCEI